MSNESHEIICFCVKGHESHKPSAKHSERRRENPGGRENLKRRNRGVQSESTAFFAGHPLELLYGYGFLMRFANRGVFHVHCRPFVSEPFVSYIVTTSLETLSASYGLEGSLGQKSQTSDKSPKYHWSRNHYTHNFCWRGFDFAITHTSVTRL